MRPIFLSCLFFFLSLVSFSQEVTVPYANNHMLFSHKDSTYLISGDSIFNVSQKPWKARAHKLELLAYHFVSNDSVAYLVSRANGIVYDFNGQEFNRLDQSFDHRSQYGMYPFIKDGNLYTFGGYGLFTFKNIITRFNLLSKETELVESLSEPSEAPKGVSETIAHFNKDVLYVANGNVAFKNFENKKQNLALNETWAFHFKDKKWRFLGETVKELLGYGHYISNFKSGNLYLLNNEFIQLDFENNKRYRYAIKNEYDPYAIALISYNQKQDGFYILKRKTKHLRFLEFIKSTDLLGEKSSVGPIYKPSMLLEILIGGVLLLLTFVGLYIKKTKKTIVEKVISKRVKIEKTLSDKEKEILHLLLKNPREYVGFRELLLLFDQNYSYDSLKKKLREHLDALDQKLMKALGSKNSVMEERKSINDARNKEVKIKS